MPATGTLEAKHEQIALLVAALERHTQRATYGAVGGVVGLPAQSVMSGQPKTPRNSWVVSAKTRLPTGYSKAECHPLLNAQRAVIDSAQDLAAWWKAHP
jgi:hypothetical protein